MPIVLHFVAARWAFIRGWLELKLIKNVVNELINFLFAAGSRTIWITSGWRFGRTNCGAGCTAIRARMSSTHRLCMTRWASIVTNENAKKWWNLIISMGGRSFYHIAYQLLSFVLGQFFIFVYWLSHQNSPDQQLFSPKIHKIKLKIKQTSNAKITCNFIFNIWEKSNIWEKYFLWTHWG